MPKQDQVIQPYVEAQNKHLLPDLTLLGVSKETIPLTKIKEIISANSEAPWTACCEALGLLPAKSLTIALESGAVCRISRAGRGDVIWVSSQEGIAALNDCFKSNVNKNSETNVRGFFLTAERVSFVPQIEPFDQKKRKESYRKALATLETSAHEVVGHGVKKGNEYVAWRTADTYKVRCGLTEAPASAEHLLAEIKALYTQEEYEKSLLEAATSEGRIFTSQNLDWTKLFLPADTAGTTAAISLKVIDGFLNVKLFNAENTRTAHFSVRPPPALMSFAKAYPLAAQLLFSEFCAVLTQEKGKNDLSAGQVGAALKKYDQVSEILEKIGKPISFESENLTISALHKNTGDHGVVVCRSEGECTVLLYFGEQSAWKDHHCVLRAKDLVAEEVGEINSQLGTLYNKVMKIKNTVAPTDITWDKDGVCARTTSNPKVTATFYRKAHEIEEARAIAKILEELQVR